MSFNGEILENNRKETVNALSGQQFPMSLRFSRQLPIMVAALKGVMVCSNSRLEANQRGLESQPWDLEGQPKCLECELYESCRHKLGSGRLDKVLEGQEGQP